MCKLNSVPLSPLGQRPWTSCHGGPSSAYPLMRRTKVPLEAGSDWATSRSLIPSRLRVAAPREEQRLTLSSRVSLPGSRLPLPDRLRERSRTGGKAISLMTLEREDGQVSGGVKKVLKCWDQSLPALPKESAASPITEGQTYGKWHPFAWNALGICYSLFTHRWFSIGGTRCGMEGHAQAHPPTMASAHFQMRTGLPFHLPVAWAGTAAWHSKRAEPAAWPPVCLSASGCTWPGEVRAACPPTHGRVGESGGWYATGPRRWGRWPTIVSPAPQHCHRFCCSGKPRGGEVALLTSRQSSYAWCQECEGELPALSPWPDGTWVAAL